jgi:phosphosulfolactate synthase
MNYVLKNLPVRSQKPRTTGFTMVMDKGLSIKEVENFVDANSDFVDIVKFGWATSYLTKNLAQKIQVYRDAGIPVYFGGTLFEAFIIRGQFDDYRRVLEKYDLSFVEVSDGSISLNHDKKCEYIEILAKDVTVLSEVGSKDAAKIIPPYKWIEQMQG